MAVRLGHVNVDAMLRSLTARQFQEWLAYARLEPFDEVRADYRAAQVAQMVLLVNLAKDAKLPTLDELLLKFGEVTEPAKASAPMDWRKMKALTQMLAASYAEPEKPHGR